MSLCRPSLPYRGASLARCDDAPHSAPSNCSVPKSHKLTRSLVPAYSCCASMLASLCVRAPADVPLSLDSPTREKNPHSIVLLAGDATPRALVSRHNALYPSLRHVNRTTQLRVRLGGCKVSLLLSSDHGAGKRSEKAGTKAKGEETALLVAAWLARTCNPSAALLCNRNVLTPSIAHPNSKGTDRESFTPARQRIDQTLERDRLRTPTPN